jgi:hypothetical protein
VIDVRLAPQAAQKRTFPYRRFVPQGDIFAEREVMKYRAAGFNPA